MRKFLIIGGFLIALFFVAPAIAEYINTDRFNYKVTVEVQTPEGIKTGSAVREFKLVRAFPEIQGLFDTRTFIKGEAVAVDLGARGVLFAVIETNDHNAIFETIKSPSVPYSREGMAYYKSIVGQKADLSFDDYPRLIKFEDIENPGSVQLTYVTDDYDYKLPGGGWVVRRKILQDNFEKLFGAGVKINRITVEVTSEPLTRNLKVPETFFKNETWEGLRSLPYGDLRKVDLTNFLRGA